MSKKLCILLLAIALLVPSMSYAADASAIQSIQREPDLLFFIDTFQYIKETYPLEIKDRELIEGGLKGMLQTIDPYSNYYTPEEAIEIYRSIYGEFSGIGVYIEEKDSFINIRDTIKGAPGEKAGLKKDDLIISIDDKDIKGISVDNAQKMMQGQAGTKVKLGIKRDNKSKPIYIEVIRDNVVINPVEYEILEDEIGYISLYEFSQSSAAEIKGVLEVFDKEGISKVILDLRNNPGGLLDQAIKISKHFIPAGPIVHIKEKNKELVTHISTNKNPKYKLVVLVNEHSASASEIVAGAVKDTKAGTIIGKKTFGKGIVQSMIPLDNGGLLKMTTAVYLTPNKTSIHGIGIDPDIVVENKSDDDLQLKRAIKELKSKN
jgi:carboxyl-terminal processing protease